MQPEYLLTQSSSRLGEEAVWTPDASRTFAELEDRARRVANGLRLRGIGLGSTFGILSRNRIEWPELVMGNVRARSKYVPLNWHLTPPEIAELLVDSAAKILVVDDTLEETGRAAAAIAGVKAVIVLGPEYEAWVGSQTNELLEEGTVGTPLLYTGGTTGRSKGVIRSDQNVLIGNYSTLAERFGTNLHMPPTGNALLCTPAYHALGFAMMQSALGQGYSLTILPRFDPVETLRTIQERKISATAMVPTQFIRLLKLEDDVSRSFDVSSLEWVLHTAAPCPVWAKEKMIDWFGPVIVELYGSSEGIGPVTCTSQEWLERPGTVGSASKVLTLSIVDENGNDLPPGEIGTVYAKRHDGTPSYHGDAEKTNSIQLGDGRFTVGDVGWLDDAGFLFLADRRTDLILRGGVNIYPAEIEAVLSQHPDVADVAVFGIPDPDLGQSIKAVVEPVEGRPVDAESLLHFASQKLASFKLPQSFDEIETLPREASGKLKKRLLRDPYWA